MEAILSQLNAYCSDILGEPQFNEGKLSSSKKTKITKELKKDDYLKNSKKEFLNKEKPSEILPSIKQITEHNESVIPVTEDGFKIMYDIPPDDSDISDAFESDIDEDEYFSDENNFKPVSNNLKEQADTEIGDTLIKNCKLVNIKKPLLKLISDFGMEDKINSHNQAKISPKADMPSHKITIIDYSQKRGKRKMSTEVKTDKLKNYEAEEKEKFKKSRHDVFKLGVSGFEKQEKENLKMAMLIRLGAKPPKKEAKNYKILMEERKAQKELVSQVSKDSISKKSKTKNIKKNKESAPLQLSMGKFKGGVLTLSKNDIKKIQSSR